MNSKINLLLCYGGQSGEHDVSIMSAQEILHGIDPERYQLFPVYISQEGEWVMAEVNQQSNLQPTSSRVALLRKNNECILTIFSDGKFSEYPMDVAFSIVHGPTGEDGCLQGYFDTVGLPYVGAGVRGSALMMDKIFTKVIAQAYDMSVTPFCAVKSCDWHEQPKNVIGLCESNVNYPMFVKPANLGSSVAISKVKNSTELSVAIEEALAYDSKVIVEQAVSNVREVEVAILGNETCKASCVGEIKPCNEFYDYDAKYLSNNSELLIPAPISEEMQSQIQAQALLIFQALDCKGLARVDFLIDDETNEIFFSEINTLPGFTKISMYPKLWRESGIDYVELLDSLIDLAMVKRSVAA